MAVQLLGTLLHVLIYGSMAPQSRSIPPRILFLEVKHLHSFTVSHVTRVCALVLSRLTTPGLCALLKVTCSE